MIWPVLNASTLLWRRGAVKSRKHSVTVAGANGNKAVKLGLRLVQNKKKNLFDALECEEESVCVTLYQRCCVCLSSHFFFFCTRLRLNVKPKRCRWRSGERQQREADRRSEERGGTFRSSKLQGEEQDVGAGGDETKPSVIWDPAGRNLPQEASETPGGKSEFGLSAATELKGRRYTD